MTNQYPQHSNKKYKHLLLMTFCCLAVIGAVIILPRYFNLGAIGILLLLLLCPISHYSLMKKIHQPHSENSNKKEEKLYRCPECGFWYKEKEWAEKCEAWCKEHKSCNIEITKHAVQRSNKN